MYNLRYFLICGDMSPELFRRRKELNEKINILVGNGVSIGDIWIIKGERLQIGIKEVEIME